VEADQANRYTDRYGRGIIRKRSNMVKEIRTTSGWRKYYVRDRDRPLALAITGGLMLVIIVVLTIVPALLAA
jgi:hypothetical protein